MSRLTTYSPSGKSLEMYSQVTVAQNEPLVNQVMNRSLVELLKNDDALVELNDDVFKKMNITSYVKGLSYNVGDIVWYRDDNGDLYLLRCIMQNNKRVPDTSGKTLEDLNDKLNTSGWENQNKNYTILDYDVSTMISVDIEEVVATHEEDKSMHPYGILNYGDGDQDPLSAHLLKGDMSNINLDRSTMFFPLMVERLESGTAIITGYSRNFGKFIEYDIILKLASSTVTYHTQLFDPGDKLSANNASFSLYAGISQKSTSFQKNKDYFYSAADMDIFTPASTGKSRCGLVVQLMRNDYVNTYSAQIIFPKPFSSINYMVFANSILSQTVGRSTMVPSANDITYCNKTRQGFTLLDITFPDSSKFGDTGYNSANGGLVANSFHCKAIGTIGA